MTPYNHTRRYQHRYQHRSQRGLTLLEVLIALSIFAMIGVASFRVLSSVSATADITLEHSTQLGRLQKAMMLMDADLQQLTSRSVRVSQTATEHDLQVNTGDYALEMTRAGWSNPLMLSRSLLQRVAYDVGTHPQADNSKSSYYKDSGVYLRRHYWRILDRSQNSQRITQVLMPNIERLSVSVISNKGRSSTWPVKSKSGKKAELKGVELTLKHSVLGDLTRLYKVY